MKWSELDKNRMKQFYDLYPDVESARKNYKRFFSDKTWNQVYRKWNGEMHKRYPTEEEIFLMENATKGSEWLSENMGISKNRVYVMASTLGIKLGKNAELIGQKFEFPDRKRSLKDRVFLRIMKFLKG